MAIASESDGKKHLMSFPPERIGHVAVCNDKYMIVWGGYNVSITYIDTVSHTSSFNVVVLIIYKMCSVLWQLFFDYLVRNMWKLKCQEFILQDDFNPPYTEKYLPANEIWIYDTEFKVWLVFLVSCWTFKQKCCPLSLDPTKQMLPSYLVNNSIKPMINIQQYQSVIWHCV